MPHDDLEQRLEDAAPPGPRDALEQEVADAVEASLARELARKRLLLITAAAALVMASVFLLGTGSGNGSGPGVDTQATQPDPDPEAPPDAVEATDEPAADPDCPSDPDHPPRLVLDLPAKGLDFGAVKQTAVIERVVRFRNEGTGILCIRRIQSGCGCLRVALADTESRRLAPGEEGRLRATLDAKGRNGNVAKTVVLHTNQPVHPIVKFRIRARVVLSLRVIPGHLNFGRAGPNQPVERTITLRAPLTDGEWEVSDLVGVAKADSKPVEYEWSAKPFVREDERVVEIRIRHPGLPKSGAMSQETITIGTTHPDRPECTVRAAIIAVDPIVALPRVVSLGLLPTDGQVTELRSVRVVLRAMDPELVFQIVGFEFLDPAGKPIAPGTSGFTALPAKLPADGQRREPWIHVGYDEERREPGQIRATLVVRTDAPVMPEVRIPCHAKFR